MTSHRFRPFAIAAAIVALASGANAQTQPLPSALTRGGQIQTAAPVGMMVAPAGGAYGPGTVVSPDHPFPTTCISGCAASLAFTPGAAGSLAVSAASARVALPAGGTVIVVNNGTTDAFYALGNGSVVATTSSFPLPAGRSLPVNVGANTFIAGITASGSTSFIMVGGSGTGNFAGGGTGGGGGGGGAVTAALGSYVDGSIVALGLTTDAVWSGSGSGTQLAVQKYAAQKIEAVRAALAGGITVSGNVGITGTLPAFAATPTFNVGTIGGISTAANQTTLITSNASILTGVGAIADAACVGTANCDMIQLLKQLHADGSTALPAGENHLGEVSGSQQSVQVSPSVTAVAYSSGWAVGGLQTITNAARVTGGKGLIQDVEVFFKSNQTSGNAAMDVFFFSDTSLSSTCTNGAAFVLSSTDFPKLIGVANLTVTTAGNTTTVVEKDNWAKGFTAASLNIYACAVTRGTPTLGTTSDLTFAYNLIR